MVVPNSPGELDPVALETSLMKTWSSEKTFEKSIENRKLDNSPFTFLEGPPTANGKPGIHHVLSRLYKDMVCRWKAMEGHVVERKGGWDTHGLPVEFEVQFRFSSHRVRWFSNKPRGRIASPVESSA